MTTSQIAGSNYRVEGGTFTFYLTIFDHSGFRLDDIWYIGESPSKPLSVLDDIRRCIADDVRAGNGDKIGQLVLAPQQAIILFLEGQLTSDHFRNATEAPGIIYVPDYELDGRTLTVVIKEKPEHSVATADAEGIPL